MEEILTQSWTDLLGRSAGLMSFRLVLQPAVAIGLAIRAGLVDAPKADSLSCGTSSRTLAGDTSFCAVVGRTSGPFSPSP